MLPASKRRRSVDWRTSTTRRRKGARLPPEEANVLVGNIRLQFHPLRMWA